MRRRKPRDAGRSRERPELTDPRREDVGLSAGASLKAIAKMHETKTDQGCFSEMHAETMVSSREI